MSALIEKLHWYYFTRGAGLVVFMNEVFLDKTSPDRTTIILAAVGLMGFDKVARTTDHEEKKPPG